MASAENKTELVLIAGGSYCEREAWIATAVLQMDILQAPSKYGVLLEGLPSGQMPLQTDHQLVIERIAPGCFCCIGQLVMRVTLNRMIRQKFDSLFIAINDPEHLANLQSLLASPAYSSHLILKNVYRL